MTTFRCKKCGHKHHITSASNQRSFASYTHLVGDDAKSLRPVRTSVPQVPAQVKGSKTGQRIAQTCFTCVVVGSLVTFPNIITLTANAVWFVSLLGGNDNWSNAIHKRLDRNRDGKLDMKDLKHAVNAVLDEVLEPEASKPPDIPVQVVKGKETIFGAITGTTQEQLAEAAQVMFSVAHKDKAFARGRVGYIFGSNEEFGRVQKEMIKLKLLDGNDNAGYKLTNEGKAFLSRYHPSPTPTEVE